MNIYIIDGAKFETVEKAYEYLRDEFKFSEYFGNNLDALWDELTDLDNVVIIIKNAREIPRKLGEYGLKILDIFGDLSEYDVEVKISW